MKPKGMKLEAMPHGLQYSCGKHRDLITESTFNLIVFDSYEIHSLIQSKERRSDTQNIILICNQ